MPKRLSLDALQAELESLRSVGIALEPDDQIRKPWVSAVYDYAEDFLSRIDSLPAYQVTRDKGAGIRKFAVREQPRTIESLLKVLGEHVDTPGLNTASGGHLGYIPGGGIYTAALGDYLSAVTNRYAGVFFASPGAVRMENLVLDWLSSLVGYPDTAAGNLTSGGSIANLIGIVAARDARGLKASEYSRAVCYLSEQTHHCVEKALRIAGMGECVRRFVTLDDGYHLRPDALETAIQEDLSEGRIPWLVVASAGTTDTGVVDPLNAVAEISERHKIWFHLDAAYGGLFALCPGMEKTLSGMNRSDSIVLDPHKGLFLPYGSGAVLVRNRNALLESHHYEANYLQDTLTSQEELSPADLSPELSRPFRGLRLWLPLMLHGLAPFRAALTEKLLLAQYFHQRMSEMPGFEVGPWPELSVVTFRYVPKNGDADAFNERLVEAMRQDGRIFISSTKLRGRFILRMAVLVFRAHRDTIDLAIEILAEKARELERA